MGKQTLNLSSALSFPVTCQLTLVRPHVSSIVLIASLLISGNCRAQDLEPRSYTNVPIDLEFVAAGLVYSHGGLSPAPGVTVKDAQLTAKAAAVGYARTFALFGQSAKFDVGTTRACIEGSATFQGEFVEGEQCGFGDPAFKLSWNFYGAPALSLQQWSSYKAGLVIGTSLQVEAPWGSYDSDKLLNTGTNQWVFRPGLGLSYTQEKWQYGLNATVRFYSDNDNFYNDVFLEKAPQYSAQIHIIYTLDSGDWLSVSGNYFFGADTTQDGADSNDEERNSRLGVTYSYAIDKRNSLKFNASTGFITRVGNDFSTYGVFWQYLL
ncbi:transporter [Shewanella maritima]|uniref:Transporter n=1 Tax=Shewanella maritima TaxID=2520507 RepID=A0A411PD38_9GAMM|nr:transporter [Shewanella maritima]QBF81431.1 transporter [Shewanella maritima]